MFRDLFASAFSGGSFYPEQVPKDRIVPQRFKRQTVAYDTAEKPGTIVIESRQHYLYYVLGNGKAIRYGVGVGRVGFGWQGVVHVGSKQEWPTWHPPKEMADRKPDVARYVKDGMGPGLKNPLGARAMYLFNDKGQDTLFRLHGTPEWASRVTDPWTDFEANGRVKMKALPDHEVYPLTAEQLAEWKHAVKPLHDSWAEAVKKAGGDAAAIDADLQAALKKYGAGI